MPQIRIALSGKMRSGKSATIQMLLDYFRCHGKSVYVTGIGMVIREICSKGFDKIDRQTLQIFGTDIVRNGCEEWFGNSDFWINYVISDMKHNSVDFDVVLMDNVRYVNEYTKLKENGFSIYRLSTTEDLQLKRDEDTVCKTTGLDHISETDLDAYEEEDKFKRVLPAYYTIHEIVDEIVKDI